MTSNKISRRPFVAALLARRGNALVIPGLGSPTWDCSAAGDSPEYLYSWGGMGLAVPTALGVALAQPERRVLALTGDGEMLMGIGSLATVGMQKPGNLSIVVLDNERYGETGGQISHTSAVADLVGVAKACGIADSQAITTMAEVQALVPKLHELKSGPRFANIKIDGANVERILPMRDGTILQRGGHGGQIEGGLDRVSTAQAHAYTPPSGIGFAGRADPAHTGQALTISQQRADGTANLFRIE